MTLSKFQRSDSGNISIMLAFLMVPMITLFLGTLEYYEHSKIKESLQVAADGAVLQAFYSKSRKWSSVQKEAHVFLRNNLVYRKKMDRINTKLKKGIVNNSYVLTYTVKTTIRPFSGLPLPFSNKITVKSTAVFDPGSKRPPHLVPNTGKGSVVIR